MTVQDLWFMCNNCTGDIQFFIYNEQGELIFAGRKDDLSEELENSNVGQFSVEDEGVFIDIEN